MTPETALAAIRFVHFGAVVLLLGTVVFRRHFAAGSLAAALAGRLVGWERAAAVVALASALGWLLAEAAVAGDGWASAADPGILTDLLTGTTFGNVWLLRAVIAILTLVAAVAGWGGALEVGAAALALSLGRVGHGVMLDGAGGWWLSAAFGLHVAAVAVWLGALPAILAALAADVPHLDRLCTIARFSRAGHLAVALTIATGCLAARGTLGTWSADLGTPYRQLLAFKMALVVALVSLALINGYVTTPRLARLLPNAARWLRLGAAGEIALAAAALAAVAVLGGLSPLG